MAVLLLVIAVALLVYFFTKSDGACKKGKCIVFKFFQKLDMFVRKIL